MGSEVSACPFKVNITLRKAGAAGFRRRRRSLERPGKERQALPRREADRFLSHAGGQARPARLEKTLYNRSRGGNVTPRSRRENT